MKKIFFLAFLLFCTTSNLPTVYAEEVASFNFVTDPQNIETNQLSGEITIQSQNASGAQQPVSETHDLAFTSTSGTGQFLNSSGNVVTTYMSKNTSNRTFYYRDSATGDFVMTISITGRESKKTFTISQHIIVGALSQTNTNTSSSTTTTTSTQENSSGQTTQSVTSAHSSPAPLSTAREGTEFEISAGRDRLTAVGNNLLFRATPTKLQNVSGQNVAYDWSFGDGTVGRGEEVSHSYKFAGEYIVVANALSSDKQAVSRIKVKVVSPEFSLTKVSEGIEVGNKSGSEINLNGWVLSSGSRNFTFPRDTLIGVNKKIIFADSVTGILGSSVVLSNPLGQQFAQINNLGADGLASVESGLSGIQAGIDDVKTKLATIIPDHTIQQTSKNNNSQTNNQVLKSQDQNYIITETEDKSVPETTNQTANMAQVFEATPKKGFVSTIFSWPIAGFNFIRRLFVEE